MVVGDQLVSVTEKEERSAFRSAITWSSAVTVPPTVRPTGHVTRSGRQNVDVKM